MSGGERAAGSGGGQGGGGASAPAWLLALDGVEGWLQAGALIADVGCGRGAATLGMALAFPRSTFVGFDGCPECVAAARAAAEAAGVSERASFELAAGGDFPGRAYDLVFSSGGSAHADAVTAACASRVRAALRPDGVWLIATPPDGGAELRQAVTAAGFTRLRSVGEAAGLVVLEVRP